MIAIELNFLTGRWHATPWGRQVNEGAVEWPPAPWRILRALLAVWHHKCADVPENEMRALVAALSSLPSYRLPPAGQSHTRHYMPLGDGKRTKIFDTFITVAPPRTGMSAPQNGLIIAWPDVELDRSQSQLLDRLLGAMTYFGRAESWVCARLLEAWDGKPNAIPANGRAAAEDTTERVRLLATLGQDEYACWRAEARETQLDRKLREKRQRALEKRKDAEKVKLSRKERDAVEARLPETVFDALHVDTGDLREAGWNRPPGSRWVDYVRPIDAFASNPRRSRRPQLSSPTVARYAVCGNVRPRLTEALWIGERVRTALMAKSQRIMKERTGREDVDAARVFSGKQNDGSPSRNGHDHAHFLCESPPHEQAGRICFLSVCAPMGFDPDDRTALSRLRRVWGHGGHDLQLVLLGLGSPEDFGGTNDKAGQSRLFAESAVWESRTPFVPTDHLRIRPSEANDPTKRAAARVRELARIVRKEFERRTWAHEHLELLVTVEPLMAPGHCGTRLGGHFTSWLRFRRERHRGNGSRGDCRGYGIRLRFSRPVRGPIVLGYGCHFGLGQFWTPPAIE